MKVNWKCHLKDKKTFIPCKGMSAMIDSRMTSGIGADILHLFNFKDGSERDAGVFYQFTKEAVKDKLKNTKMMFNNCPFCDAEILFERREKK